MPPITPQGRPTLCLADNTPAPPADGRPRPQEAGRPFCRVRPAHVLAACLGLRFPGKDRLAVLGPCLPPAAHT